MTNYDLTPMLAVREVAQLLNVHRNTVRRWNSRGIIKGYSISHRGDLRFRRRDVIRFARELKVSRGDERKAALIVTQDLR